MSREYVTKPIVAVSVAIFCGDEVLLIKRGKEPNKGRYSLPGGGQRLGETTRQAALRELEEETGIVASGLRLVEVLDSLHHDQEGRLQLHYVIVVFTAEVSPQARAQTRANSDADEVLWGLLSEVSHLQLTEGLFDILQKARTGLG
jgi:8-oxo-dGTP diphosphatase